MLPDYLDNDLLGVFVGTAKSRTSAAAGHYYAHESNHFWSLLAATDLTDGEYLGPSRDHEVLSYRIGLTDLVPRRAASSDAALKPGDYDVPAFLTKMIRFSPSVIAFNGENAATKLARHLKQPKPNEGPIPWRIGEARAYRLPSSSRAQTMNVAEKHRAWKRFGDWIRAEQ